MGLRGPSGGPTSPAWAPIPSLVCGCFSSEPAAFPLPLLLAWASLQTGLCGLMDRRLWELQASSCPGPLGGPEEKWQLVSQGIAWILTYVAMRLWPLGASSDFDSESFPNSSQSCQDPHLLCTCASVSPDLPWSQRAPRSVSILLTQGQA